MTAQAHREPVSTSGTVAFWCYRIHQIAAAMFVAVLVFQMFSVGMAMFVSGTGWGMHVHVGNLINIFPILMILTSMIGGMNWAIRGLSIGVFFLVGMQHITIFLGSWVAALHPVNAVILLALGATLYRLSTAAQLSSKRSGQT